MYDNLKTQKKQKITKMEVLMLKIQSKKSLYISIGLSVVLFCACIVGAFIMPILADRLIILIYNEALRGELTAANRTLIIALAYGILFIIACADALLFALLLRVRRELVFTDKSVSLIRGVSWCCLSLGAVFIGMGFYFHLSFIVAFLAVFLGLCIRVVKNAIETATEIKNENDLTV